MRRTYCFLFITLIIFISGCSHNARSRFVSSDVSKYNEKINRVYIVSFISMYGFKQDRFNEYFKRSILSEFQKEGIQATYKSSNWIYLDPNDFGKEAKEIDANFVLIIKAISGTQLGFYSLKDAAYAVSLLESNYNRIAWSANINFYPYFSSWNGVNWDERSSDVLARDIIDRLKKNGFI